MATVKYSRVDKWFGKTEVLKCFNLIVQDGEFLVLVGPSGCGKTTLLRLLAGLEEVSSGEIYIDDRLVNDVPPKDRDIAMVFQNYALYPHMDVYNNLAFGLKLRKYSKVEIKERVRTASKILEIADLQHRRPKALSGGQRQRVALGRAIVRQPKVFLFDEPLSNLDAKLRVQMRAEIKNLHAKLKTTMVYVTHDQVEAMTMGDRIVILKDGVVQQMGSPSEVYDTPANVFVAGFIGSPSMNLIRGTWDGENFITDGIAFPLEGDDRLEQHRGEEVVMGIRPENIVLADASNTTAILPLTIQEPLGSEVLLHFKAGETKIVAKLPSKEATHLPSEVPVRFEPEAIHYFNSRSGEVM